MKKRTRNIMIASAAVLAAALVAFPAAMALAPGSVSRYIDEDHYTGEIVTDTTTDSNHGGHSGWTDLNATQTNTVDGVSWSVDNDGHDICTISSAGNYFLSGDVQGQIAVTANGTSSSRAEVNLCLNGHVLDGNGAGTALLIGDATENDVKDGNNKVTDEWGNPTYVTVNLYDCGGEKDTDGNYDNVHYYKHGTAHTLSDGTAVYEGYDFSDSTLTAETADGYVRGGLITGGKASDSYYGGGVTVGYDTELNMYGGTVAGNAATAENSGGGVGVWNASFCLYGGIIEGNRNSYGGRTAAGGVFLCPNFIADSDNSNENYETVGEGYAGFYMYGGEIKENYTAGRGGGVCAYGYSDSGHHETWFYMYGGVIEGNHAGQGGGGVYVRGDSTEQNETHFHMDGGEIRDNTADGSGAGVQVHSICECYIAGRITGNRSTKIDSYDNFWGSGGLYCVDICGGTYSSVIEIGGSAYIYGNYSNGKKSNFGEYLHSYSKYAYITLGDLTAGARIGVTCPSGNTQITVAEGSGKASSCLKYFYSDDSAYNVGVNGSGSSSYIQLVAR